MAIGICIAIDLLRQNKESKFVIIEKGNQIGGTWNDNQVLLNITEFPFSPTLTFRKVSWLLLRCLESPLLALIRTKPGMDPRIPRPGRDPPISQESMP